MNMKKVLSTLLAAAMLCAGLAGCGAASSGSASDGAPVTADTAATAAAPSGAGDTITIGLNSDIVSLDPAFAYDHTTNQVVNQITEGLLTLDSDGVIQNKLCKSWQAMDPLTYVYDIRDDVKFSDGTPMTMDDVLFSVKRHMDTALASYLAWFFDNVESIEQTGDWQLTVKLSKPDASWQYAFASTAGHIISKAYCEAHPDDFGTPTGGILGTGAYVLDSWTTGSEIVLKANDNYWAGETPDAKTVDFQVIEDDTTRITAMVNGQLDLTLDPPTELLSQLESAGNVQLSEVPAFSVLYMAMNCQKEPFNDVNVRKAISYAIDKKALYDSMLTKEGTLANSSVPFSESLYGADAAAWKEFVPTVPECTADLEKAKAAMAASAYPDGFDCTLAVNNNSLRNSIALYVQQALKQIGINVTIETKSGDEMITVQFGSNGRDYDMAIVKWEADYPDPSGNVYPLYYSANASEGGANTCNYANPAYDALIDTELASTDLSERTASMESALNILAEDCPSVIFYYPVKRLAMNTRVTGFDVNASMIWNFYIKDIKLAS